MKRMKRYIIAFVAVAALALSVFSCITFDTIKLTENPQANSIMTADVQITFQAETERDGYFTLAMLVPKSWKVAQSIKATYSANNLQQKGGIQVDVVDEEMVIGNAVIEPSTGLPYNSAMLSKYGVLGNTGPVEWIVLMGTTMINTDASSEAPVNVANVHIEFKTGANNVKFFTGFATCLSLNGFNDGNDGEYIASDPIMVTVTGGSGNDDFTVVHYTSTTPQTFRYGDIVSIEFASEADGIPTDLKGEEKVYLCGTATLNDGSKVSVEGASDANLMVKTGELTYMKYIYPKQFFKVPAGKEIEDLWVSFRNADGSKVANGDGAGFQISQAAE